MADTNISWATKVWNPTRGCRRISPGCGGANGEGGCYAERTAYRFSGPGQPYDGLVKLTAHGPRWTGSGRFVPEKLAEPLSWKRPQRVFVDSMSDLFFDEFTNEQIAAVFGVMAACPQHDFQVLTKRARRMREWFEWLATATSIDLERHDSLINITMRYMPMLNGNSQLGRQLCNALHAGRRGPWPLPNVHLGVSVENQAAADERIPDLLATPAAVRWLSCEPLLGPVDLDPPRCDGRHCGPDEWGVADDEATPWCTEHDQELSYGHWLTEEVGIDWVVAGCESGTGARRCNVEWLRSLRDQCAAASVPFWLKQATPWNKGAEVVVAMGVGFGPGSKRKPGGVIELPYLDGVQHAAFPEPR